MKLLDEDALRSYLARSDKEDGEVVGLDQTMYPEGLPHTVHWDGDAGTTYVSGDTVLEWGLHNLNEAELDRCGFTQAHVDAAADLGEDFTLEELEAAVAARAAMSP